MLLRTQRKENLKKDNRKKSKNIRPNNRECIDACIHFYFLHIDDVYSLTVTDKTQGEIINTLSKCVCVCIIFCMCEPTGNIISTAFTHTKYKSIIYNNEYIHANSLCVLFSNTKNKISGTYVSTWNSTNK